jgi:Hint domain
MSGDPSAFSYMYSLEVDSGGNFILTDGSPGGGLTPATLDVSVKDDVQDGQADRHATIGDVANDQFHVTKAEGLNGLYTFVSLGLSGDPDHPGMIARNEATGQYYFFTNDLIDASQEGSPLSTETGGLQVCFMPGTLIATPVGDTLVEDLRIGDMVTTADGRSSPVRWIGRQTVAPVFADEAGLPVRVKAGALADAIPSRDLLLSPDHALMIDGVLIHAGAMVNGVSIVRERDVPVMFTYFHVETENHALILAEGAVAETFIDNVDRMRFDNWPEYQALYPDARPMAELPFPRAKGFRQVPMAVRAMLAARATLIAEETAKAA